MLVLYGILFVISLYIIFIICLRVRHPYWSKQPVYHSHKLLYKFYHPGIVKHFPSDKDRYVDLKDIEFCKINNNSNYDKISKFLCENYSKNEYTVFKPSSKYIKSYYEGSSDKSYVSFMKHNSLKYTTETEVKEEEIIVGLLTTRPLIVKLDSKYLNIELVDLLCINPLYRKGYRVPKLIQTHKYHMEQKTKKAGIYLFKNENHNSFNIIPLCKFECYAFDIFTWRTPIKLGQEEIIESNEYTSELMYETIMLSKFKNKIYFDLYTMNNLVKSGNIHLYCLKVKSKILGLYFFKNSQTIYNKELVFECVCSIRLTGIELFLKGFHNAVNLCCKKNKYRYLVIENTSNNNIVINKILSSKSYINKYYSSYYTYNYITKQLNPNDSMFLI